MYYKYTYIINCYCYCLILWVRWKRRVLRVDFNTVSDWLWLSSWILGSDSSRRQVLNVGKQIWRGQFFEWLKRPKSVWSGIFNTPRVFNSLGEKEKESAEFCHDNRDRDTRITWLTRGAKIFNRFYGNAQPTGYVWPGHGQSQAKPIDLCIGLTVWRAVPAKIITCYMLSPHGAAELVAHIFRGLKEHTPVINRNSLHELDAWLETAIMTSATVNAAVRT